jgi:hypothetical protein
VGGFGRVCVCVCVCVYVCYKYLETVLLTPFRSLVSFSEFARPLFIDGNALREHYVEPHHLV